MWTSRFALWKLRPTPTGPPFHNANRITARKPDLGWRLPRSSEGRRASSHSTLDVWKPGKCRAERRGRKTEAPRHRHRENELVQVIEGKEIEQNVVTEHADRGNPSEAQV